jgi:hypothetical protein
MTDFRTSTSCIIRNAFILLMVLVMASCASMGDKRKKSSENLRDSVEAFNSAFRWEDYQTATAFLNPSKKEAFWKEVDRFKGKIHIIDYQVREVQHEEIALRGTAIVFIQYYRTAVPNVLTTTLTQKWYYAEKEKMWQLGKSGLEAITKEDPGF